MTRWCAAAMALSVGLALLGTPAAAQNLEAGKSPGQLFSNTCAACHRSPRGLLRTVPPGSLPGFLREHYTTSREMAQQLAGFLISSGAADTRGRPQEARQQPAGAEPGRPPRAGEPEPAAQPRQSETTQPMRPQRPVEQEQGTRPPEPQQAARPDPREEARIARRERRAKREAERAAAAQQDARKDKERRSRITPARIDAASQRGKDALPLGAVVPAQPVETAKPDTGVPAASDAKSEPTPAPETATRVDPVPQVTPAPPPAPPPAVAEPPTGSSAAPEPGQGADDSSSNTGAAETPPASNEPPPKPPISN